MINLVKSEILKVRSTQVWIWMMLLAVGLTALLTATQALTATSAADLASGRDVSYYDLFTTSSSASTALLVLGVLGLTTEFRHKTITPTVLATPNRWKMLLGKSVAYFLFAVVYAGVCIAVNVVTAAICLGAKHYPFRIGGDVPVGMVKAFLALVLFGMLGVGLGAIVRNQAAAMVLAIVWFTVLALALENIPYLRKAYPFEPGGAVQSFLSHGHFDSHWGDVSYPSPAVSGLILAAWALALLVLGGVVSLSRDIS